MTVDPARAAGSADFQGKRYSFCSRHCLNAFRAEPAKYAAKSQPAAPAAAPLGAKYTCPMHPEVVQVGPGSCPKCGMALVPVAGAEEDNAELRDMTRRFRVSAVLSAPLVAIAMGPYFGWSEPFGIPPHVRGYVELALGTPVVLWGGWPFFRKFWLSLKNRSPNMYTLIGLGLRSPISSASRRYSRPASFQRNSACTAARRSAPISRPRRSS